MHNEFLTITKFKVLASSTPDHSEVPEALSLAKDLVQGHQAETVALATLLTLTESLLTQFGSRVGQDVGPLLALHIDCVNAWMQAKQIAQEDLEVAVACMTRATETVRFLSQMPA